eukprot:Pgem_evm1s9887
MSYHDREQSQSQFQSQSQLQPLCKDVQETQPKQKGEQQQQTVVLIDPPRSGLDCKTATFINELKFDYLIYIACGEGLTKNIMQFSNYEMIEILYADHFP